MCVPMIAGAVSALTTASSATMFALQLGVGALSTAATFVSQQQAAEAQVEAQNANIMATHEAAVSNLVQQTGDLHAREQQTKASVALDLANKKSQAARAAATAAATSESAGLSFDGMMDDFDRQYANYADSQMQQLGYDLDQMDRVREGLAADAQSRVNLVPRSPVQFPTVGGAVAGFAGSAFNAFDRYSVRDPITGNRTLT